MKKATETGLVKAIIDRLTFMGCDVWRQNQGAMTLQHKGKSRFFRFAYRKGIGDIIGYTPEGFIIGLEVKMPGRKATPDQLSYIAGIQKTPFGVSGIVYSVDSACELIINRRRPDRG